MKGETCKGPECDREQGHSFDLCQAHRNQQRRNGVLKPLNKRQRTFPVDATCNFEGCNNKRHSKGWCGTHYWQYHNGKEMTPVERNEAQCRWEDCLDPAVTKGLCKRHYDKEWKEMNRAGGFSDTKTCDTCKKTKKWNLFVMGLENSNRRAECKDCFRDRVISPKDDDKPSQKSRQNWEDLMGFLETVGKQEG